jgi:hypothetical protein
MKQFILSMLMGVLLCLGSTLPAMAQNYDPENPPEPYLNNLVTVTGTPQEAVSWLEGGGYYKPGETVYLCAYSVSDHYTFLYWNKNGEFYSDEQRTVYTMENEPVTFTAVFEYTFVFDPESPAEPEMDDNRLFIVAEPLTACSFNRQSGSSIKFDEYVYLDAYPNNGYSFLGWYKDGILQSESLSYGFNMPEEDVRLVARFEYNPPSPEEPESDPTQENIQTTPTGDADGDGSVEVIDAVRIINLILRGEYDPKADVNGDGMIDVRDAVGVINIRMRYIAKP